MTCLPVCAISRHAEIVLARISIGRPMFIEPSGGTLFCLQDEKSGVEVAAWLPSHEFTTHRVRSWKSCMHQFVTVEWLRTVFQMVTQIGIQSQKTDPAEWSIGLIKYLIPANNCRLLIITYNHPACDITVKWTCNPVKSTELEQVSPFFHKCSLPADFSLFFISQGVQIQFIAELLWSSIFVTLMANKIGGLQFGIYRNCQISSRVFHTAVAALPLTKANRSDFE